MNDVDELTAILLTEWNKKCYNYNIKDSFGAYIKNNHPIIYEEVMKQELEEWKKQYLRG